MSGSSRCYGCPGIENVLAARCRSGLYLVLTDLISQEPTFVEVIDAIPSGIEPNRLSRFVARSFDGRTGFEGTVELRDGRFVADVVLTPVLPRAATA